MISKKFKKLIGLKFEDFNQFVKSGQIKLQEVRLIPTHKTGDEMALTSIFLSSIKLIKEFRDSVFKEVKLPRTGKPYYFSEIYFPELDNSRFDGLIIIVSKGKIIDAIIFEMKNKNNGIDGSQVQKYIELAKQIGVQKMVTISNEFVANSNLSPVKVKTPRNFSLLHFSWTYILTLGQLLLFKNSDNIKDEDQIEIMKEVLHYMENPVSGVSGYSQMKSGWKITTENIKASKPQKLSDPNLEEAVLSWYEEEKDLALLMSRKLGVLVKPSSKDEKSLKKDISTLCKTNSIKGSLSVKNSVSDIKINSDFKSRSVTVSVKVIPPQDAGTVARVSWINRQLQNCKKKSSHAFEMIENDIWIEANIKYAKSNIKVKLDHLEELKGIDRSKEIQAINVIVVRDFGASFGSSKKFIEKIEELILSYYGGIVQHMTNWNRPAPKIN